MAFIDELHLHLKAGRGGNGVVRWLHLKGKEFSGPAGGNGGRGGDVVVEGIRDIGALLRYRDQNQYAAGDGAPGGSRSKEGRNGDDFVFKFPLGTVITRTKLDERWEILEEGQREVLLKGGNGGYGNEHFKGSRNVTPMQSTKGKPGDEDDFDIELQLVVDAGLIGMPNAGKSSLLNALTGAHAKVGAYEFTTLNPNLGVLYGYVLADIPGLISGAAEGKGLGHTFLRHIKRTRMLVHCISLEREDVAEAYATVRNELSKYSPELSGKEEIVVLTKTDVYEPETVEKTKKEFCKKTTISPERVSTCSIYDDASLKALGEHLTQVLKKSKV